MSASMSISDENFNPNKTSLYFYKASKFLVIGGMPDYIKWRESGYTWPIYKYIQNFLTICIFIFVALELGSFVTQKNLSEKQFSDLLIFSFSHLTLTSYPFIFEYHKERVRNLLSKLCIDLKNVYNDPEVERQMIKKLTIYSVAYILNLMTAMFSYGFDGVMLALRNGTFVTVVTAWPEINDTSVQANIGRVIIYLIWLVWATRVSAAFVFLMITTGCLGYQFKNLQSYFYSLAGVLDEESVGGTDRRSAEQKYEDALKVGIQLHADTLWCTRQCQIVSGLVYSVQMVLNVFVISFHMFLILSAERTLAATLAMFLASVALLASTGIAMWNAGDVTVEAALVPTAMYSSGWQNCRGKSLQRVRKLLVIAMNQAQKPVVLRSFGMIEISYQSYVSMVKACYSAFSLMY